MPLAMAAGGVGSGVWNETGETAVFAGVKA